MNKKSALSALHTISEKVHTCTQNEVSSEVVACLESASKKLFEAVQGDAYAKDCTNTLVVYVRAGFLGGSSKSSSYRKDILEAVETLSSYISQQPDFYSDT